MDHDENSCSYGQLHHGNMPTYASHAEVFGETSNHPLDSVPLQPRFGLLAQKFYNFWLFPKLKSPLKGKRFQTIDEIQENMKGQLMETGRTARGPKLPTLKGTEASLSYVQCFLYLVSSSINVFIFHITWLDTFWRDLVSTKAGQISFLKIN